MRRATFCAGCFSHAVNFFVANKFRRKHTCQILIVGSIVTTAKAKNTAKNWFTSIVENLRENTSHFISSAISLFSFSTIHFSKCKMKKILYKALNMPSCVTLFYMLLWCLLFFFQYACICFAFNPIHRKINSFHFQDINENTSVLPSESINFKLRNISKIQFLQTYKTFKLLNRRMANTASSWWVLRNTGMDFISHTLILFSLSSLHYFVVWSLFGRQRNQEFKKSRKSIRKTRYIWRAIQHMNTCQETYWFCVIHLLNRLKIGNTCINNTPGYIEEEIATIKSVEGLQWIEITLSPSPATRGGNWAISPMFSC